jgi:hypothetical protein
MSHNFDLIARVLLVKFDDFRFYLVINQLSESGKSLMKLLKKSTRFSKPFENRNQTMQLEHRLRSSILLAGIGGGVVFNTHSTPRKMRARYHGFSHASSLGKYVGLYLVETATHWHNQGQLLFVYISRMIRTSQKLHTKVIRIMARSTKGDNLDHISGITVLKDA